MNHVSPIGGQYGFSGSPAEDTVETSPDLNNLLSRCSELSKDLARMHKLLERIAQNAATHNFMKEERDGYRVPTLPNPPIRRSLSFTKSRLRLRQETDANRVPVRSELSRACRIALIEVSEPAAVETIYDLIQRRGSFSFAGYTHPFRAIVLAMNAMVRQGEATLLIYGGHRRWCSSAGRVLFDQFASKRI